MWYFDALAKLTAVRVTQLDAIYCMDFEDQKTFKSENIARPEKKKRVLSIFERHLM